MPSLDKVWTDLCFELEATFADMRQATKWPAHFDSTDVGPNITTATYDQCWVTRHRRTDVVCRMRVMALPGGDNERTFRFRLDADAAFPVVRLEGDTEIPETAASAARYLLDTFRELGAAGTRQPDQPAADPTNEGT